MGLFQEWEEKAREDKKRYEAEMEKWRADGGEEKLKAAKKAAKRAEKAASSPKKKAGGGKSSFTNSTKISLHFPIYTMYLIKHILSLLTKSL